MCFRNVFEVNGRYGVYNMDGLRLRAGVIQRLLRGRQNLGDLVIITVGDVRNVDVAVAVSCERAEICPSSGV